MSELLQSPGMVPVKNVPSWECRHCKHTWPISDLKAIANEKLRPKQCPNRNCRAADWDRDKLKPGRPRKRSTRRKGK